MNKIYRILGRKGRITIPYEMRVKLGFAYNDVLSFENTDKGVVVKREKICDNCKTAEVDKPTDTVTLLDFLDGLTAAEKSAALYHLAVVVGKQSDGGEAHA